MAQTPFIKNSEKVVLEACVESLSEAISAEKQGATRIELCGNLSLDGVTPDKSLTKRVLESVNIPIKVMIRPRGGDFIYSPKELSIMKKSITYCRQIGIKEIVIGILKRSGDLDIAMIRELSQFAEPMSITIHKAIDHANNPLDEIGKLKDIPNIKYILTSGKQSAAVGGSSLIKRMIEASGENIKIIVAGKVTKENLSQVKSLTGASEFHGRKIVGHLS